MRHLLRAGDAAAAAALLESAETWFFERGAAAGYLMLGELLPPSAGRAAAGDRAGLRRGHQRAPGPGFHWLDLCDERIADDTVVPAGETPAPPR